jgi:hypothetical protein
VDSSTWRVRALRRVGLYLLISLPATQRHSGGWIRSLGGSARYDALAFVYLFRSQPPRDTLGGGFVHLASPRVTTRWSLSIYFASSLPETLWGVDSSTWRVRALRRVGLYLLISLPTSQRHSGGWIRSLGGSARYDALAFVYLFRSQPPRDTLGGGFVHLASPRVTTRWSLSIYFASSLPETLWGVDSSTWRVHTLRHVGLYLLISLPASQRHSGGWIRSLGGSVRYDALVFIHLFRSQPPRDTLGGGLVRLTTPRVTTRWSLSAYFAPSLPETLWEVGSSAWRICTLRRVGFIYFVPCHPEILWKVGLSAW